MATHAALCAATLVGVCHAQKGLASLNDPCDCMQHHDFWMMSRAAWIDIFWVPGFAERMFLPGDPVHAWVSSQSCMYSPENEEAHRPAAVSDCIPGFLLVHIICMQRHILDHRPERAMDYAAELMRLYPFGMNCIDESGWPLTSDQVMRYYRRVRRVFAAGPRQGEPWPEELLREMAWHPYETGELTEKVEEPDICPGGTLPDTGVCWTLGAPGADCRDACAAAGLAFRQLDPELWPSQPLVPRILKTSARPTPDMIMQEPWAAFECYVATEARFHLAKHTEPMDDSWSYPICSLACPCGPELSAEMMDILESLPPLPEL